MREKVPFLDIFSMEYSFGGTFGFRESCLEVVTADGQRGQELAYTEYWIYEGKAEYKSYSLGIAVAERYLDANESFYWQF